MQENQSHKLGDIAEFINGGAWNQSEYSDSGIPVVRVSDIHECTADLSDCKYLLHSSYQKYAKHELKEGDLVICTVGSHPTQPNSVVGRPGIMPKSCAGSLLNQNAVCIRPSSQQLDNQWLGYFARSQTMKDYIIAHARGSASQVRVAIGALKDMDVVLPSLEAQQEVARILTAYDKLIENNNRRIAILEEMAQSLYREWFVNFRFPGYENAKFNDSPQGKIPNGWGVSTLGDEVEIRKGKNITKKTIVDGDVPVVAGGLLPAYFHNCANTSYPVVTVSASGANAGYVNLYGKDVWASDCSYIDSDSTPYVYYYYLFLKVKQREVFRLQHGSAQPHVYPKDLMRMEKLRVPRDVLVEFEVIALSMFKAVHVLKKKNERLAASRDLLLPKLISGKIDI